MDRPVRGRTALPGRILPIYTCQALANPGTEALPMGSGAYPYGERGINGRGGQGHHVAIFRGRSLHVCDAGTLTW